MSKTGDPYEKKKRKKDKGEALIKQLEGSIPEKRSEYKI